MYRRRREAQGVYAEANRRDEVNLDPEVLLMSDGNTFLLADDCEGERILVFASSRGKDILKKQKVFSWMEHSRV